MPRPGLSFSTALLVAAATCSGASNARTYEAESGTLLGQTRIAHEKPDGTGRGFVTGFALPADGIEISVKAPETGYYFLEFGYACDAAKRIPVFVNNRAQGSRLFPKTTGFAENRYGRVFLEAGENTIRVGTDWGYVDIDFIRLIPAKAPAPFRLAKTPVNRRASPEARGLFTSLTRQFGNTTLAGQHESNSKEGTRLAHVKQLTQDSPAILGLDLTLYSPSWGRPDGDGMIDIARDWATHRKGIVTLSWHWLAPVGASELIWDSFWTKRTTFDLRRVKDEASAEYLAVIRDLDHIAEKLKVLRDARVPVLWRPLHEAEGGWFWWGAHGPEATKHLYLLMFDRFTHIHQLDNLLWVWTTTDDPGARDWYPGDRYVDIVATDLYSPAGTHGDFFTVFDELRERYHGRKPIALGECGVIPSINTHAPWLWFLVWDDFITRPEVNPPDLIVRTYADPNVITLDRLTETQPQRPTSPRTPRSFFRHDQPASRRSFRN
jgi:mannan endo-1,4-beta-mannosidase